VLRSLQASRVVFTPHLRERERFYSFEGSGTVSPIIRGVLPIAWASPRRFTPTCSTGAHPASKAPSTS
jgi:hypothetical protein